MVKKYFIFAILLFFLNSSFALALEAKYPVVPGLPAITDDSRLPDLIRYFFGLAIFAAGILAVVFLIIGAVRLIISAGNPSLRKDATDAIRGSILGLILIISSFILLRTINPQLITPSMEPLPPTEGIFYVGGENRRPAPMSESDTRNVPTGYSQILYDCSSGPDLFLWRFPKTNFEGTDDAFVETLKCQDIVPIAGARSFKMAFKTSGIYYFLKDNCQGYMSEANLSGGQILEPFKNKIKSINIINDITSDVRYGVIFHDIDDPQKVGRCTLSYLTYDIAQKEKCISSIPISSSATFFAQNAKTPETSGQGVDFYSEPWGNNVGARAGKYFLAKDQIKNYLDIDARELVFGYEGVNRPAGYKELYKNFSQHPGSVIQKGNYMVVLYGGAEYPAPCQIFFKNITNMNEIEFIARKNGVNVFTIVPIK